MLPFFTGMAEALCDCDTAVLARATVYCNGQLNFSVGSGLPLPLYSITPHSFDFLDVGLEPGMKDDAVDDLRVKTRMPRHISGTRIGKAASIQYNID